MAYLQGRLQYCCPRCVWGAQNHAHVVLILLQAVIFLPLALVRNLAKLSTTALIADVFILAGLIYIFGSEAGIVADRGIAHVELFNPTEWPLLIGLVISMVHGTIQTSELHAFNRTAVFSFEGIGLVRAFCLLSAFFQLSD